MTVLRKAVIRTVRLDDDVWLAIKGMECSLNQYLRMALLETGREVIHPIPQSPVTVLPAAEPFEPLQDNRPKNCYCKHCGVRFAGAKFATLCSECKSSGHTNQPNECPKCNEGNAI